ncbi:MAG: hypothetical protein J0H36_14775 [Hyphomicrobium denitrificans]|nr:hypothetical protein [Hyphomicrobium denitrificans]
MQSTPTSDYATTDERGRSLTSDDANGNGVANVVQEGVDVLKNNPVLTLVAVGVLGFAIGTLAGRSTVRRRSTLDANLDSIQLALESARSGTSDTIGSWAKSFRNSGYLPDHVPVRVKQQVRRLLSSVS